MRKGWWIGWVFLVAASSVFASAVDIVSVRFNDRRLPGQSLPWLEAEITLRPTVAVGVEDLSVSCVLLLQVGNTRSVYSGKAKISALEATARVRFYLPPDLLRVRRLTQTPSAYLVEVSSSAGSASAHSPTLTTPAAREALKHTPPSGALLPHYFTPFYSVAETLRDLPAYVIP